MSDVLRTEDKGTKTAIDIYDDLTAHATILEAFASLLNGFNYEEYSCTLEGYGLKGVVGLWLKEQDRILGKYNHLPDGNREIIAGVKAIVDLVETGCFLTNYSAINKLEQAIRELDEIVDTDETEKIADELQNTCKKYIKQLKGGKDAKKKLKQYTGKSAHACHAVKHSNRRIRVIGYALDACMCKNHNGTPATM